MNDRKPPRERKPGSKLSLEGRNGRQRYSDATKARLVDCCLKPGVSIPALAAEHGVSTSALYRWVSLERNIRSSGTLPQKAASRQPGGFIPVQLIAATKPPQASESRDGSKVARIPQVGTPRLTATMPNGVLLTLDGGDAAFLAEIIASLGRYDVSAIR
jgi:transposase